MKSILSILEKIKESTLRGYRWLGLDGIINLESSALLMLFFKIFFPTFVSIAITLFVVLSKSLFDKSKGRTNEQHDILCSIIGVILGLLLSLK